MKKGIIKITFNCNKKTISVVDDGVGISNNKLSYLLTPFSSDKSNENISRGEKGVGLSFVIFETNYFKIKTSYLGSNVATIGVIQNARSWVESDDSNVITMSQYTKPERFNGTEVLLKDIGSNNLFDLSLNQLLFILRTKTAIGDLQSLFDIGASDISVELIYIDKSGKSETIKVKYNYFLPIEIYKKSLDYRIVSDFFNNSNNSDSDKKEYIKNKIIFLQDSYQKSNGFEIQFWSCFVPDRTVWELININNKLINTDSSDSDSSICFNPGVTISCKGMPTAISYPLPSRIGNAGYLPNFFMIINDDSFVPDIGRKAVMDEYRRDYDTLIKKIFNKFAVEIAPFMRDEQVEEWDMVAIKEEIDNLPKLNTDIIKFKCSPFDQEASIAAIFFELVGNGSCFKNFIPYYSAYRNKYDLYGYFKKKFITLEFKYNLRNIIKDFKTYKKLENEINYVVCWDVSEKDESELFKKIGVKIRNIEIDDYDNSCKYMPEATHKIIYSEYATPVFVIDLKKVLENLKSNKNIYNI